MPETIAVENIQKRSVGMGVGWEEANVTQLIVFRLGPEIFGIPIDDVREIIRSGTITPIPDSPPFVKGLINVRGDIIPTINLSVCFALEEGDVSHQHIIVTRNQPSVYGLLVDEVTEVLRIQQSSIRPPPKLLTTIHEKYVAGVVTVDEQLTIVLDLKEVLSDEEIERLNEVTRKHIMKAEERKEAPAAREERPEAGGQMTGEKKKKTTGKK